MTVDDSLRLPSARSGATPLHARVSPLVRRAAALVAFVVVAMWSTFAAAATSQPLFRIERSKNANVVQYDAVTASPETLDGKTPVTNYWIRYAEDGRREAVGALAQRAYGFKVVPENDGAWLMYMKASPVRAIRVVRWAGRWVAQMTIAGRSAVLSKMYVSANDKALIPSVRYVDLFGTDMATGQPLTERMTP
jgi:hypothetical protein